MWQTIGEFFRDMGADFPMESFKIRLRAMKPEHMEGSKPYKYRREDLETAYREMCEHSLFMRKRTMK